jgi:hypothetical protein
MSVKFQQMATIFNQTFVNPKDSHQSFTTVFTPSICYPLAATSTRKSQLQSLQKPVIHAVLARMGFNRHMPREVVLASRLKSGIGLLDLYSEQGARQVQLIISHLRAQSYLHPTFIILLESFQLSAGLIENPLFYTGPIQYVRSPWLLSLREYLNNIKASIVINEIKTLQPIRKYDQPIMNQNYLLQYTKSQQEQINAVRLYLKVTTIAEISNNNGNKFIDSALYCTSNANQEPILWEISTSLLQWPRQVKPSKCAISLW